MKKGKRFKNEKIDKKSSERKRKIKIPVFRIISILILIICFIYIFMWVNDNKHSEEVMQIIEEAIIPETNNSEEKFSIDFNKLKGINTDVVGWIKVNNTNINYPVVQTSDNSYYLTHSFDKAYNAAGWPFMDYNVDMNSKNRNKTIYGHNRKDGSMFSSLKNILEPDWYNNKDNLRIEFLTEEGNEYYQVFSIYRIEKETYYTNNYFENDEKFLDFINEIKSRSINNFNIEVNANDEILTLSTCADNSQYRVVLHAKKEQ